MNLSALFIVNGKRGEEKRPRENAGALHTSEMKRNQTAKRDSTRCFKTCLGSAPIC